MTTLNELKSLALTNSLFPKTSLKEAVDRLGFVQIDPIRSPAPAQDLILRQRVKNYRVGDIDASYQELLLEEDHLYAHGYIVKELWRLLHPRKAKLTAFDKDVLKIVASLPEVDDKRLGDYFTDKKVVNWWGGYSQATNFSLNRLHYYGLIRVVRRQKGKRVYQAFTLEDQQLSLEERLSILILAIVKIHQPISQKLLNEALHRIREHFGKTQKIIDRLVSTEKLGKCTIESQTYYWSASASKGDNQEFGVRILAPFDPLVRDRTRFSHFWNWDYRFEAYTPVSKRIRGYYAMPLLWKSDVIGWANLKVKNNTLDIDLGFVGGRPKTQLFEQELDIELADIKRFLCLPS